MCTRCCPSRHLLLRNSRPSPLHLCSCIIYNERESVWCIVLCWLVLAWVVACVCCAHCGEVTVRWWHRRCVRRCLGDGVAVDGRVERLVGHWMKCGSPANRDRVVRYIRCSARQRERETFTGLARNSRCASMLAHRNDAAAVILRAPCFYRSLTQLSLGSPSCVGVYSP